LLTKHPSHPQASPEAINDSSPSDFKLEALNISRQQNPGGI